MKCKIFFLLIMVFFSCNIKQEEIPGTYISKNQINNIDTLRIFSDGTYEKKVYKKSDNSLIFHNTGGWNYKEARITFKDFFYDNDEIFSKDFKNFKDILITSSFTVEREAGKISIEFLEDKAQFRYNKL